jgi:hypothetical protein
MPPVPQTRPYQLARAFLEAAKVNQYMIGVASPMTQDELKEAEQILVLHQNMLTDGTPSWRAHELALALLAHFWKGQ